MWQEREMEAAAMKEEIELYLPNDHNVAQDIIIPPGVDPGKRYSAATGKLLLEVNLGFLSKVRHGISSLPSGEVN